MENLIIEQGVVSNSESTLEEVGEVILYRIENKNIKSNPDGVISHDDLIGQWFTPSLDTALNYLRKSQKVPGAKLVIVKIPGSKLNDLNVIKHSIASKMDVESDNFIVPIETERSYIDLDDVQGNVGNINNFKIAKEQIKHKVSEFLAK
jgi:hypothetical protein